MRWHLRLSIPLFMLFLINILPVSRAEAQLAPARSLAALTKTDARLNPTQTIEPLSALESLAAPTLRDAWSGFQAGAAESWSAHLDARNGRVASAEGAGLPWIPGPGNGLRREDLASVLGGKAEPDLATLEKLARSFLAERGSLFGVESKDLVLSRGRSGQVADHVWLVDFDLQREGRLVEGARVVFRVGQGNLVQLGSELVPSPSAKVPAAKVSRDKAWETFAAYVGIETPRDVVLDAGSLHLLPTAIDDLRLANGYAFGEGYGLALVWEFSFRRTGELGTWRGRVDAASGELRELVNTDVDARATGGVAADAVAGTETVRPLPFVDLGGGAFANSSGVYPFTGPPLTSTLNARFVRISDTCGTISLTSNAAGDLPFGSAPGNNCTTPGVGGLGNTRSTRTSFYHLNRAKEIGRGWLPGNNWLNNPVGSPLLASVNNTGTCNGFWNGTSIQLFRAVPAQCGASGEEPGFILHEYGHGLDANDGNGLNGQTSEAYGDVTAAITLRNSCVGPGFWLANCTGYGDPCTACTGLRDMDWARHASGVPHTVSNYTQVHCPGGGGPCGREVHCETHVATESIWDFANRDLPSPGSGSAWGILERLWYLSRSTATAAFACTQGTTFTSNGCNAGSWWKTMRLMDDDDGNLANGTPHSCSLFAAFNRHGTACTTDPGANTCFAGCTPPAVPTLTLTPGDNQVQLSWTNSGAGVVYDVYRNDLGCNRGFARIADNLAATSFTDTTVANDFGYFYQVIAHPSGNEACSAAPTACQTVTPLQKTDVWSKDLPADTGLEPDPATAGQPMWQSQDIWVRNTNTAGPHQNPEAGQVNFVHVMVRNRSTVTALNTPVKLYFANASTGLSWPIHWTLIGTAVIPTLAGAATTDVVIQWTPTQTGHFCLLSRLDTPQDPMTFTETVDINFNVRFNNNIVWKNVNVVDLVPGAGVAQPRFIFRAIRRLRSPGTASAKAAIPAPVTEFTQLIFREPANQQGTKSFLKRGRVTVLLPEELVAKLEEQGIEPEGFDALGGGAYRLLDGAGGSIGLYLTEGEEFDIDVKIEDTEPRTATPTEPQPTENVIVIAKPRTVSYTLEVVQAQEGEEVGGVTYDLKAPGILAHVDQVPTEPVPHEP
jgi:hypothetical protein